MALLQFLGAQGRCPPSPVVTSGDHMANDGSGFELGPLGTTKTITSIKKKKN